MLQRMVQIEDGVFEMGEAMPCMPREIKVARYVIPVTLRKQVLEEAAARVLLFSKQLDRWVGVSWQKLFVIMLDEYFLYQRYEAVQSHNLKEDLRFKKETRKRYFLSFLTFGVYAYFTERPKEKDLWEVPVFTKPDSSVFLTGPNPIVEALDELVDEDLLCHRQVVEGDELVDVVCPTPKLVRSIMAVQRYSTIQ